MKNKYRRTMDEMVDMIKDYLEKHPEIKGDDFKNGYRKALEDFLFIIA